MKHRMSLRCAAIAALPAGALALSAAADFIEQELPFEFVLSPGSAVLPFEKFDDAGGTLFLREVTLEATGQVCMEGSLENDSTQWVVGAILYLQGFQTATCEDLQTACEFTEVAFAPSLAPSDGVPGSGPDFWDFGALCGSCDETDATTDPAALAAFIGSGTVNAYVDASADPSVYGVLGAYTLTVTDLRAAGTVSVTYVYTSCPADINGDDVVDVLDLLLMLAAWGNAGGPADVNGDGIVDVLDLLEILAAWGPCP